MDKKDSTIADLRFEAKAIESQIQQLSIEKAELEKLIREFHIDYNQELGELILSILQNRKEKYKGTSQGKETQKDYDDFFLNYKESRNEQIISLSEEEKKELKDKYRKASKLCHPDVVEDKHKAEANRIFSELSEAYSRNDLNKVSEILNLLEQGKAFRSKADSADQIVALKTEIARLKEYLNKLYKEVDAIKNSETYLLIIQIKNRKDYFGQIKKELLQQLNQGQNGKH